MGRRIVVAAVWAALAGVGGVRADEAEEARRLERYGAYLEFNDKLEHATLRPGWLPDGDAFWYADGEPDDRVLLRVDPAANTVTPLFDTARLRRALAGDLGHEPPGRGVPFDGVRLTDEGRTANFRVEDHDYALDLATYELKRLPQKSAAQRERETPRKIRDGFSAGSPPTLEVRSPDGRWFATERDDDLWLRSTVDDRLARITTDGDADHPWSVADAAWSPDSFKLFVSRADNTGVDRLPIVHWLKPVEDVEWAPYTKAGRPMPVTTLYVVDTLGKQAVAIEGSGLPDHYYFKIGWREGGNEVLFLRMNRRYQALDLLAADPSTGKSRVVVSERSDTFLGALRFFVTWRNVHTSVGDGERFVWWAERDGWYHLYLYDYSGKQLAQLTRGAFPVLQTVAIDNDGGWVYFTAHAEPDPYDTHVYRVDFGGKRFKRLTEAEGQHAASFSPSKRWFVDTHSSPGRPPRHELRAADGTLVRTVLECDVSGLDGLGWSPPEEFVVKAADGETDLHGVLFKPADFDPTRKYPVLDSIYNGPFITWVPRTFDGPRAITPRALAQLGFVVLVVDGRGTPERGKAFQDVVYRNFGRNEIPDHAAALRGLAAERPWMDLDRVGIFGGSWGGYMTIRAMVTHPDTYHAGVALNSVADFYDHASVPIEGYMGLPQDNREGYEHGSSILLADRLKGHLLLVHGTIDVNATFSATMKMVDALVRAGKQHDLVVLPESNHWPTDDNLKYFQEALRLYFQQHLRSADVVRAE